MSEGNGYANPQQLFAQTAARYEDVTVPGVGKFLIRNLSELEKSNFESWITRKGAGGKPQSARMKTSRAKLITLCVVDPQTRQPAYTEADIERLMPVDGLCTGVLFDRIMAHTGYSESDLEELVKNSPPTPVVDSPTT